MSVELLKKIYFHRPCVESMMHYINNEGETSMITNEVFAMCHVQSYLCEMIFMICSWKIFQLWRR